MLLENDTQINMQNNLYYYKKSTHPTILYEQPEIYCYIIRDFYQMTWILIKLACIGLSLR